MARIDIKGIHKRQSNLAACAKDYAIASEKARKARGPSKSNRIAEEQAALMRLVHSAIDLVGGLATADDGKGPHDQVVILDWIRAIETDPIAFAAVLQALKKQPYARVFARAEKEAAK